MKFKNNLANKYFYFWIIWEIYKISSFASISAQEPRAPLSQPQSTHASDRFHHVADPSQLPHLDGITYNYKKLLFIK
jgi:hypothetical protein